MRNRNLQKARQMKLLALSDMVDERVYSEHLVANYGDADLVLGCGDLPYEYLEYVVTVINRPLMYVHGNHDPAPLYTADGETKHGPDGSEPLDDRIALVKGALFMGLGGSIRYSPEATYQYTPSQMRWRIARMLPSLLANRLRYGRFVDVVVAHSPPYGIHDGDDPAHIGFRSFLGLMRRFRPRLLLHGHMHRARAQTTQFEDTTVMGVFPVRMIELELDAV